MTISYREWLSSGKTYAQALTDVRTTPLADLLHPSEGDSYPRTVAETVLLTAAYAETLDPDAQTVLGVLALPSPAGIPRSLLAELLTNLPNPVDKQRADQVLAILAQASLIGYSLENTMVLMHRLTQRVLRDRAAGNGTLQALIADMTTALSTQAISDEQAWSRRAEAAVLISQTTALSEHARTSDTTETETDSGTDRDLLDLRAWAVQHLLDVRNFTQAIAIGETLAADATAFLGPDDSDTWYYCDRLATAHQHAGRSTEAINLFRGVLAVKKRVLGPDEQSTLSTQHNLALAYRIAGRTTKAIDPYEAVLTDRQRILGPDHPDTRFTSKSLADARQLALRRNRLTQIWLKVRRRPQQ